MGGGARAVAPGHCVYNNDGGVLFPVCQCALAAVFALGGGGSCRVDRYDVRVMRYEVGALGWVSAAFVV